MRYGKSVRGSVPHPLLEAVMVKPLWFGALVVAVVPAAGGCGANTTGTADADRPYKLNASPDMPNAFELNSDDEGPFGAIRAATAGTSISVTVSPQKRTFRFGDLTIAESCQISIHKDGTLLANREEIQAEHKGGGRWMSRKANLDGQDLIAFYRTP